MAKPWEYLVAALLYGIGGTVIAYFLPAPIAYLATIPYLLMFFSLQYAYESWNESRNK